MLVCKEQKATDQLADLLLEKEEEQKATDQLVEEKG